MSESLKSIPLGNSGIEVSAVGYGTYHLREKLGGSDAIDSIAKAFDEGVTFFDSSDNYGTEDLIGLAVSEGALPRDEVVIATKTGLATSAEEHLRWEAEGKRSDTSPARIKSQVDKSLRMLGPKVDVIDLYQLHVHDPTVSPSEVAVTMKELIEQGKIRAWGVSNYRMNNLASLLMACDIEGAPRPVTSQPFLNIVEGAGEDVAGPLAENMAVLAHSPLLKGILVDPVVSQLSDALEDDHREDMEPLKKGVEALQALQDYARERSLTLAQFAIAWVANIPDTVVLSACTNDRYLHDAIYGSQQVLDMNDPDLTAIRAQFKNTNFVNMAVRIMRASKIYYK